MTPGKFLFRIAPVVFAFSLLGTKGYAVPWLSIGPEGGDARAFAADPSDHAHIYLGTADSWIYQSHDGGMHWDRTARIGQQDNLVIDNILVDPINPKHLVVGAWALSSKPDGGIYESRDGGSTWTSNGQMQGQSIRALTAAPSDSKTVVAGTLEGVYRSIDSGAHWQRISPPENKEIHEVESIAIDPTNPKIIYAGTWHLPWKTTDGGATWSPMTQGIIVDSDVFSIIVDPRNPSVIYLSACSGIYKSVDGGASFKGGVGVNKGQGIPASSRRTRVLMLDPTNSSTVFAGTTEGLFRTQDAGAAWSRMTRNDVIVNDVYVDPTDSKHVLLATDRGGVLASRDGGSSFVASDAGFSQRQVDAYVADARDPQTIYVGVVNDKEQGGAFVTHNGGTSWTQVSAGLEGRDVFSMVQAPDGSIVAGTSHGIFRLKDEMWQRMPASLVMPLHRKPLQTAARKGAAPARKTETVRKPAVTRIPPGKSFDGFAYSLARGGDTLFAATSSGVLRSDSNGSMWTLAPELQTAEWRHVAAVDGTVVVASLYRMEVSHDGGESWTAVKPPQQVTEISAVAVDREGNIWAGGRQGALYSSDQGNTWTMPDRLYARNIDSLYFDQANSRMLVTSNGPTTVAFAVETPTMKVKWWDTGWSLRLLRPVGDHFAAATLYDGLVVQPRMVDSAELQKHSSRASE